MNRKPKVAVIVSNYNGATNLYKGKSILCRVFTSLKKTAYTNYNVILADDASTDNSVEYTKGTFPNVKIITNRSNGGYAKNNNKGIRYSLTSLKADYVLLLNNDIIIKDPQWLDKLVSAAEERKGELGIEGCRFEYPNGITQYTVMRIDGDKNTKLKASQYADEVYVKEVIFACVLLPSNVIKEVGLLDENFYMGREDGDYCFRILKNGFKILYNGKICLTHLGSHSTHNAVQKEVRDKMFYVGLRNAAYYVYKNCNVIDWPAELLWIICGAVFTVEDKNHIKNISNFRIKKYPIWRFKASIKAVFEGYKIFKLYKIHR